MRIPRIYEPQSLNEGSEIRLGDGASAHIGRVLRMQSGDKVVIFNGEGAEFTGELAAVSKKHVSVVLLEKCTPTTESPLKIYLGQGLSRGERMDYVVQKTTELGVNQITPIVSERCEVRLKADRLAKRTDHWQQIAISACEQSFRCDVPVIETACALQAWVEMVEAEVKFVLDPRAPKSISSMDSPASVALLVGPEGGLTEVEIDYAISHGFTSLSLGPRVLRTETAAVAALSVMQYRWGDLA